MMSKDYATTSTKLKPKKLKRKSRGPTKKRTKARKKKPQSEKTKKNSKLK